MQLTSKNYISVEQRITNQRNSLRQAGPFSIDYTSQQKLFRNLPKINFESICLQERTFKDTKTTTWTGKQVPILVFVF